MRPLRRTAAGLDGRTAAGLDGRMVAGADARAMLLWHGACFNDDAWAVAVNGGQPIEREKGP